MFERICRLNRRFARDDRGVVGILVAMFMTIALIVVAMVVDIGWLYLEKRRAQSAVDIAAIAAAADLGNAEKAARASLLANGYANPAEFTVTLGAYQRDTTIQPSKRFQAGQTPYSAVKVSFARSTPQFFGRAVGRSDLATIRVAGMGVVSRAAALSIGSRLASLNGGVANTLLSSLLGGSVSLSVMDYNSLANAKLDALPFLNALAARVGLTAGTYSQLLSTQVKATDLVRAIADVAQGSSSVKAVLAGIAANIDATRLVDMSKMISLGPFAKLAIGDTSSAIGIGLSALDVLNVGAQLANGTRQVAVDLGVALPGLASVTATIDVGERQQTTPWLSVGDAGIIVRTAQTRIRLAVRVGGTGSLLGQLLYLPIAIDLAGAQARMTNLSCGRNPSSDARITVAALPSVAELWVGDPQDPNAWSKGVGSPTMVPATTVNLLNLTKVTVYAHSALTNTGEQTLTFTYDDVQALNTKTVKTTGALQTALGSLTRSLEIKLWLLGIDITLTNPLLTGLVSAILTPVGALLDPVVDSLLDMLGVSIGEADVQVRGLKCQGGALVG